MISMPGWETRGEISRLRAAPGGRPDRDAAGTRGETRATSLEVHGYGRVQERKPTVSAPPPDPGAALELRPAATLRIRAAPSGQPKRLPL